MCSKPSPWARGWAHHQPALCGMVSRERFSVMRLSNSEYNMLSYSSGYTHDESERYETGMSIRDLPPSAIVIEYDISTRQLEHLIDDSDDSGVTHKERDYDCSRCDAPFARLVAVYAGAKVEHLTTYCSECAASKFGYTNAYYTTSDEAKRAIAFDLGFIATPPCNTPIPRSGDMLDEAGRRGPSDERMNR